MCDSRGLMIGLLAAVSSKGDYGFVTNVAEMSGDTFLHISNLRHGGSLPEVGAWIEYRYVKSSRGHKALEAVVCELDEAARMDRLLQQYGPAMKTNHGAQRLDGLTQLEAKQLKNRGIITRVDYYACMSECGIKEVAKHKKVEYQPGQRLETARMIVEALDKAEIVA